MAMQQKKKELAFRKEAEFQAMQKKRPDTEIEKKRKHFLNMSGEYHNHKDDLFINRFQYVPEIFNLNLENFETLPLAFPKYDNYSILRF